MRLRNNAAILTVITLAAGSATAFIPSRNANHAAAVFSNTGSASAPSGSGLSVAATVDESTETSTVELDMDGIKKMTFRQLQKSCVDRGLPAVGNTAALRARLLESAGLPVPGAGSAPAAGSASHDGPDEVSRYIIFSTYLENGRYSTIKHTLRQKEHEDEQARTYDRKAYISMNSPAGRRIYRSVYDASICYNTGAFFTLLISHTHISYLIYIFSSHIEYNDNSAPLMIFNSPMKATLSLNSSLS